MSLRPALKDHMRWVDQKFKEWDHWDEQVLDEMESSKQDFKRGRVHRRARPHGKVAYERRPIALYCDGHADTQHNYLTKSRPVTILLSSKPRYLFVTVIRIRNPLEI